MSSYLQKDYFKMTIEILDTYILYSQDVDMNFNSIQIIHRLQHPDLQ